jgi:hypothetical protein
MTRRFGYWIIGTALGMAPLSGCALLGRGTTEPQENEASQLMAFWNREFHGRGNAALARTADMDRPTLVLESQSTAPQPGTIQEGPVTTAGLDPSHSGAAVTVTQLPNRTSLAADTPTAGQPSPALARLEPGRHVALVDALQCVFDNRHSEAVQYLRAYNQPTQEICLRLFPVLAVMAQKSIDELSAPEVANLNDQLQSLSDLLRPYSLLTIDKACFCEEIKSFGRYKPVPEGHAFLAAAPNRPGARVLLYVELRNFASQFKDGSFVTRLSSSIEIRDQKGSPVCGFREFPEEKQPIHTWTQLKDFCNKYSFPVPNLPAGTYTLVIEVTDLARPEQPAASKAIEFRVTSRMP